MVLSKSIIAKEVSFEWSRQYRILFTEPKVTATLHVSIIILKKFTLSLNLETCYVVLTFAFNLLIKS